MKIYFGGKFENRLLIKTLIKYVISSCDFEIKSMSLWTELEEPLMNLKDRAAVDFNSIDASDLMIAIQPFGHGTVAEMSYCLGKKLPVICLFDKIHKKVGRMEWGWTDPLSLGMLSDFDSDKQVRRNEFGYVVGDLDNLICCLNYYEKNKGQINK